MLKTRASLLLTLVFAVVNYAAASPSFITTNGIGVDKWASVWLLIGSTDARVSVTTDSSTIHSSEAVIFDVQGYPLTRDGSTTTYDKLLTHLSIKNEVLTNLGMLIQEIEIDSWRGSVSWQSSLVEQGFREMQLRYGRERVTQACYLQFFNIVAAGIMENSFEISTNPSELIPKTECLHEEPLADSSEDFSHIVPTLALDDVLLTGLGEDVAFVDTRELWEFEEGHIPGSINLTLRDIDEASVSHLRDVSTVIAYCVKDFRGYEAARKMRLMGINAAIMTPHGMRGWIEAKLPVAGSRGLSEFEAAEQLRAVAESRVN